MHSGISSSPGYQALAVSFAFESSFPFSSSSAAKYWRGLLQFLVLAVLIGQPKKKTMLLYEIVAMFTFIKLYSFLHWVWGSLHMVDVILGGVIQVLLCLKSILFLLDDAGFIFSCTKHLCTGTYWHLSLASLPGDLWLDVTLISFGFHIRMI